MKKTVLIFVLILLFNSVANALCITDGAGYYTYQWFFSDGRDSGKEGDQYVFFIDAAKDGRIVNADGSVAYKEDFDIGLPGIPYIFDYFLVEFVSGPYSGSATFEPAAECHYYGGIDPASIDVTEFSVSTASGRIGGFGHAYGEVFYFSEIIGTECIQAGWFDLVDFAPAAIPEPSTLLLIVTGGAFVFGHRRKYVL